MEPYELMEWRDFICSVMDSVYLIGSARFIDMQNIILSDHKDNRCLVLNADQKTVKVIGREGDGPGEFRGPTSIAISNDGRFYIWEYWRGAVSMFDKSGDFINRRSFSHIGNKKLAPLSSGEIAIAFQGVFPSGTLSGKVAILSEDSDSCIEFEAAPDLDNGIKVTKAKSTELSYLTVGHSKNGSVLVADSNRYILRKYSTNNNIPTLEWESKIIDNSFQPAILTTTGPQDIYASRVLNTIDELCEISDYGFVVGIARIPSSPSQSGFSMETFLDFIAISIGGECKLINRIKITDNMRVGDIKRIDSESIHILTFSSGILCLPAIRIYSIPIEYVFTQ